MSINDLKIQQFLNCKYYHHGVHSYARLGDGELTLTLPGPGKLPSLLNDLPQDVIQNIAKLLQLKSISHVCGKFYLGPTCLMVTQFANSLVSGTTINST